jgi:hypothetical protein
MNNIYVLTTDFLENQKQKNYNLINEVSTPKQRRADAKIMINLLNIASEYLPKKIDITQLTFTSKNGIVSVASITSLIQKNIKRERFYIFCKNRPHIKETNGKVIIMIVKATLEEKVVVSVKDIINKEINLKLITELLENGKASIL